MRIEYFIGAVLFIFCVFAVVLLGILFLQRVNQLIGERMELRQELYQEKAEKEALENRIRKFELLKNISE